MTNCKTMYTDLADKVKAFFNKKNEGKMVYVEETYIVMQPIEFAMHTLLSFILYGIIFGLF